MRGVTRLRIALLALALAAGFVWAGGWRTGGRGEAIELDGGALLIRNVDDREWRNVVVYVNDHYRGSARSLAPGAILRPALRDFVDGYNRRFNPSAHAVFGVLLTAEDDRGRKVRYTHGTVNR